MQKEYEIRLSISISTALFLSTHGEKVPLVIILHGFDSSNEDHTYQAVHLASWGMHSLSLQLPNKGRWVSNGKTLAKIVQFIYRWLEMFDNHADLSKIILVGHSLGGVAAAVALAEGAPATGAI